MMEIITPHRKALADALARLTPAQWAGPTLCTKWTPGHVLAHLTMPYRLSGPDFMAGLQRCGGDFTTFSDQVAEADSSIPQAELIRVLADNAGTPWEPPGGGLIGALSHDVIHGLDMTWLAGIDYDIPSAAMTAVLDSATSPVPAGARDQLAAEVSPDADQATVFGFPLAGIRVIATDLDWSAGQGAELTGLSRDVLPLLARRAIPRDRFAGPGADRAWQLAAR
jgi:uncharacterized protein (TIGR03083 family)